MIRAKSVIAAAVLMAFAASAWAVEVSSVQGEATHEKEPRFDIAKQVMIFDGKEYKWTDLIEVKFRPMQAPPKDCFKIFFRNGNIIYGDVAGAAVQGVTLLLKVKSPFLGSEVVVISTDNLAGIQNLNHRVYLELACLYLMNEARRAPFRVIDVIGGRPMNAQQIQDLFNTDPDQFGPEAENRLNDKSKSFEKYVRDEAKAAWDFMYGTKNPEVVGTIQSIADNLDITFQNRAGKNVTGNLNDLVGLLFKAVNQPQGFGDKPYVKIVGLTGDTITGQIVSEKDGVIEIKTDVGDQSIKVPVSQIAEMVFYNGSFTFLSDLPESAVTAIEFGDIALPGDKTSEVFSWQRDRGTMQMHPALKLGGKTYRKGIGVHSFSDLTFNVGGQYKKFRATVGIDDNVPTPGGGNVTIEIQGDGKVLFAKTAVKTGDRPLQIDVDVTGVTNLKIVVDFGENGFINDHCDIVNAILLK
jgi:hypothetical protein